MLNTIKYNNHLDFEKLCTKAFKFAPFSISFDKKNYYYLVTFHINIFIGVFHINYFLGHFNIIF